MPRSPVLAALAAAALLALPAAAGAATYQVGTTADTPAPCPGFTGCSLRGAIAAANATVGVADVVEVPAGVYELTQAAELVVSDDLTIRRTGGGYVSIDAAGASRVIHATGVTTDLVVQGVDVARGYVSTSPAVGGGILADGPLTLQDVMVRGNSLSTVGSATGAGVYAASTLTVSDSTIRDNLAFGTGIASAGGLYAGGMATLTNVTMHDNYAESISAAAQGGAVSAMGGLLVSVSTIRDNMATSGGAAPASGGGILASGGTFALQSSVVRRNTATGDSAIGGGLWRTGGTDSEILSSRVTDNTAMGGRAMGGGAYLNAPATTLTGSTVDANDAVATGSNRGAAGGGISVDVLGDLDATSSTIAGNTVRAEGTGNSALGAGLLLSASGSTLAGVTVTGNTATGNGAAGQVAGGGVAGSGAATALSAAGSIVSGNVQPDPSADCAEATLTSGGGNVVNQVDGATGCAYVAAAADVVTDAPGLDALADHGGLTPTMRLAPGSPALDRYSGGACPATDQRGIARPQGAACDSGAFESRPARLVPDVPGMDFGTLDVGTPSTLRTLTLGNAGDLPATGIALVVAGPAAGDFLLSGDTCGATLGAQASCTLDVRFTPSAPGARSASLTGPDTPVALTGTGAGDPGPSAGSGEPIPACDELGAAIGFETEVTFALRCTATVWHWQVVEAPQHGRLSPIDRGGRVRYTPDPGFSGDDAFRYRALGPGGASEPAIARITVGSRPAAPAASPLVVTEPTVTCPAVPDLGSRTLRGARRALAGAGCDDVPLTVHRRGEAPRRVVRQTPAAGTVVRTGGRITVTLRPAKRD